MITEQNQLAESSNLIYTSIPPMLRPLVALRWPERARALLWWTGRMILCGCATLMRSWRRINVSRLARQDELFFLFRLTNWIDNSISQLIKKNMQSNATDVIFIGWVWRVSIYSKLHRNDWSLSKDWSLILNKWKWDTRVEQPKENLFDNQPREHMSYECWDLKGIAVLILLCEEEDDSWSFWREEWL